MEIKIATVDEAADLFELNTLFGNTTTLELISKSLADNDGEIACIAYVDGIAAGFCTGFLNKSMCHSESRAYIEGLYVREECRGKGIGRALMLFLLKAFADRGIRHFHTDTYLNNAEAIALCESVGFVHDGAVLLEKSITQ